MAKFVEKIKARELRKKGESIRQIAKTLKVSKSTASSWCKDVELTASQIKHLEKRRSLGGYKGRMKGARMQHDRRLREIQKLEERGRELAGRLSKRDVLLLGVALYWGEGMKKEGRARIVNSDPRIITFMLRWFQDMWHIPKEDITPSIIINQSHKDRVREVERHWSHVLKIPITQFTKTTLIKSKNKKIYKNHAEHYGTITISIRRGSNLRHVINGIIDGLYKDIIESPA